MNRKNILQYILALIVCFLLGMALALGLRALDMRTIAPLEGGQTLEFTDFGFTMRVPETAVLRDHTEENYQNGGDALYAGSITTQEDGVLYVFCYENAALDNILSYPQKELIHHYMSAGATDVRMREFGSRSFVCYRAAITGPAGPELWDTYETWNETVQITFETRMSPDTALPLLFTMDFADHTP